MNKKKKIKMIFSDGEVMFDDGTTEEFLIDHEGVYCWVTGILNQQKHYISEGEFLPPNYEGKGVCNDKSRIR